jgi:hypothetical protein
MEGKVGKEGWREEEREREREVTENLLNTPIPEHYSHVALTLMI